MTATEYIKAHVSPLMLLKHYNAKHISHAGRDIRCCCPLHNGNNPTAFVFNTDNNLWFCHTSDCGGGDIFDFVMIKENVDFIEAVKHIANVFNIDITELELKARASDVIKEHKRWIESMRRTLKQREDIAYDIKTLGDCFGINKYRQFNKEILENFGIKFCGNNKRIVVPINYINTTVGVTMRRTDNHPAKWLHQPTGFKTSNYLYNYDNVKTLKPIILVEGVWDCINYVQSGWENTVASFGCHLSENQEALILKSTYDLIIAYDNDTAGIEGTKYVISKLKHKINIRVAKIPQGKDAGECTKEELDNSINNSYLTHEWRKIYGN